MTKSKTDGDPIVQSIANIEKKFGKGSIMRLGMAPNIEVDVIPTGLLSLDIITGIGGMPRGRIVEFFGPESAGKTMLSLYVLLEAQKMGLEVAFVDAEHALNIELARYFGIDVDKLLVSQPDGGEEALEIVSMLTEGGGVGLIIVDSVAALVPRAEVDGDMGDAHVGLQARLMSQAMRKLTAPAKGNNTCIIFINQLRMKVNTGPWGSPETTPGGRALPFYASMRLDVRSVGRIKDGEAVIGRRTRIKVVKNKLAAPFRQTDVDLMFTDNELGFDRMQDILEQAIRYDVIIKKGAWYQYQGENIGQGAINAKKAIVDKQDMIKQQIMDAIKKENVTPDE